MRSGVGLLGRAHDEPNGWIGSDTAAHIPGISDWLVGCRADPDQAVSRSSAESSGARMACRVGVPPLRHSGHPGDSQSPQWVFRSLVTVPQPRSLSRLPRFRWKQAMSLRFSTVEQCHDRLNLPGVRSLQDGRPTPGGSVQPWPGRRWPQHPAPCRFGPSSLPADVWQRS
jgi:hypothetical protein